MLGDLVTAARNRVRGARGPGESTYTGRAITAPGKVASRYYVSMSVTDEPGVLAQVVEELHEALEVVAVRLEAPDPVGGELPDPRT